MSWCMEETGYSVFLRGGGGGGGVERGLRCKAGESCVSGQVKGVLGGR